MEQERKDSLWLADHAQELVEKYPDHWIAGYKGRIVAIGDDSEQVVKLAKESEGMACRPVVQFVEGGTYVYNY